MHMSKYIKQLLCRFQLEDCKPTFTLVKTRFIFLLEDGGELLDASYISKILCVYCIYATQGWTFNLGFHS